MKVIVAASETVNRWIGLPLPDLSEYAEKRLGEGLIVNDKNLVSFQCHLLPHKTLGAKVDNLATRPSGLAADLIFIGAYTRYVLIFPNVRNSDVDVIEREYLYRQCAEVAQIMKSLGADQALIDQCIIELNANGISFDWYKYKAPNVRLRIKEVKDVLKEYYAHNPSGSLTDEHAFELGMELNTRNVSAQLFMEGDKIDHFVPIERMLMDWLVRFGDGLHALVPTASKGNSQKYEVLGNKSDLFKAEITRLRESKIAPLDTYVRRKQLA